MVIEHDLKITVTMLYTSFKIALRGIRRNARLFVINITGLGIALAFCILAFLNYRFANTYDHWHPAAERIVRVEMIKASNNEPFGVCAAGLSQVATQLAGVERVVTWDDIGTVVKQGDHVFNEPLHFTDEQFAQCFDFELVAGSNDLSDRNSVLISEEAAQKFFGAENPMGKSLLFFADSDHRRMLTVSGVLKTPPMNSSIRFRFITHRDNQPDGIGRADYTSWKWSANAIFLKLKNKEDRLAVEQGLQQFAVLRNTARPDWTINGFKLAPLREIALNSRELRSNALWQGAPSASVWGNITLALMLLLTAALNFANMTIAACNRRLREMGVRKVMGGTRFQLISQLLSETLLIVGMATLLGMALAYPIVDWYNAAWQFTDFKLQYGNDLQLLTYIGIVVLATTLLAGSYPAFYISAFRPSSIFRGGILFGGKNIISRIMMGLQVVISIISVVTGLSFARNAEYNRTADMGFAYQNVLQAWLEDDKSYRVFENAAKNIAGVEATVGSQHLPGFGYTMSEFLFRGTPQEVFTYDVGNNFLQTMEFHLLAGDYPAPAGDTSISHEVVVNETFVREAANGKNPIGETFIHAGIEYRITGIVRDFVSNLFSEQRPSMIRLVPQSQYSRCIIKVASIEQTKPVLAALEKEWKSLFPYTPFNVGYQNEMLFQATQISETIANTMGVFSIITVLLSMVGLFSLISLDVLRRLREVAIRRVLGASTAHITWILNKNLILVLLLSITVGCFTGGAFAGLLMNSIFKINIGIHPMVLLYSGMGVIAIVAGTIGFKIWQTLRINPADVLRGD